MNENKMVLHTVDEVSKTLSISRSCLYELIRSNQITSVLIGRCRRIPAFAVEEYVERLVKEQEERR